MINAAGKTVSASAVSVEMLVSDVSRPALLARWRERSW